MSKYTQVYFSILLIISIFCFVNFNLIAQEINQNIDQTDLQNNENQNLDQANQNYNKEPERKEEKIELLLEEDVSLYFLEYVYSPEGRRDPFRGFISLPTDDTMLEIANSIAGPMLPLQNYELSQLKLVGIMWGIKNPKAMILDPKKKVHLIGKDERVGNKNGYIAVIREGEVVVVEPVKIRGQATFAPRVLKLER